MVFAWQVCTLEAKEQLRQALSETATMEAAIHTTSAKAGGGVKASPDAAENSLHLVAGARAWDPPGTAAAACEAWAPGHYVF